MKMEHKIDRFGVVSRHNPRLTRIDPVSPLTVGNGNFAFTADVTGLQSLYEEYKAGLPLCTMSVWGWHSEPASCPGGSYTLDDLVMTEFEKDGRKFRYPKRKAEGNEEVYEWLRKNPHRLNLGRVGFLYRGRELKEADLSEIRQELFLYEGRLESSFKLGGARTEVHTAADSEEASLAIRVKTDLFVSGELKILFAFPYGSPDYTASDWERGELHETSIVRREEKSLTLERRLNQTVYRVKLDWEGDAATEEEEVCRHRLLFCPCSEEITFTVRFLDCEDGPKEDQSEEGAGAVFARAGAWWKNFWEKGGIADFSGSTDRRAFELERRIVLSNYLLAVNSCGNAPPQETGLTANSWYGKMHLEMYLWHCGWLPLWNHTDLLERSLSWYLEHLEEARENAARNGFRGARWPKMVALGGIDCPSAVAPLLIWQQPHLIFMLELAYRQNPNTEFLKKYWILVKESADFMADFAEYREETGRYDLKWPLIPAQECHRPEVSLNPAFEVQYWKEMLGVAVEWAERLGQKADPVWVQVSDKMADLPADGSVYLAHENCPDTFEQYNRDHPSMLCAFGLLRGERADRRIMERTLKKVTDCWNFESMWGWDFAVMAMTAARLSDPDTAFSILLKDTPKNEYVASGNNRQSARKDLQLYLPGNGSLLLAVPLLLAGYDGCEEELPGIPKDGGIQVRFENIGRFR